jgi:peptidoglycan/xylan/chitin deacetylase (PgdA/CDA1 family)
MFKQSLMKFRNYLAMTKLKQLITSFAIAIIVYLTCSSPVLAAGKVSFTFDDGYASVYDNALPILSKFNFPGTSYIITNDVGKSGTLTWNQISELQNTYGWEIGSHTVSHPELSKLTRSEISNEVYNSLEILLSHQLSVSTFATPYGDYNNNVLAEVMKYYGLHRSFWDVGLNSFPYDRSLVNVHFLETRTTLAQVKTWVNQTVSSNGWLVLVFHEILPTTDPNYTYISTPQQLEDIASYVSTSGAQVVLPRFSLQEPGENLVPNNSFEQNLTGWSTNNSIKVAVDTNTNGSYPYPKNSVIFSGNSTSSYLFSDKINVTFSGEYLLEAYTNTSGLTGGEYGYYIDEYDKNNNWISGQWLGLVANGAVKYFEKIYKPTSNQVNTVRLQTYLNAGSVGNVFLDNLKFYNLHPEVTPTVTPTPTPTFIPVPTGTITPSPTILPTPTTTPIPTIMPTPTPISNLVANPSFETTDGNGFVMNWSRDNGVFLLDTNSMGNDGVNSIHASANTLYGHLFSDNISIDNKKSYIWSQFVRTNFGTGEFGFYIDEYDSNNNWISGQWKGMSNSVNSGTIIISYTPSSNNVTRVRLQYYLVPSSTLDVYLDLVKFSSRIN